MKKLFWIFSLILSVGLNYRNHLEEMAGAPVPTHPARFITAQNSLIGSDNQVNLLAGPDPDCGIMKGCSVVRRNWTGIDE